MSAKIGRPVIGEAKSIDLKVRIDKTMNSKLVKYAEKHGVTKAEAVRQCITYTLENKKE